MFSFLAEQDSLTSYEPNEPLDDMTSNNFASMLGGSGSSSIGSSSTSAVTDCVATTMPVTDSLNQAPRDRLRQQEHKRRFSPGEGRSSRENNRQKSREIVHLKGGDCVLGPGRGREGRGGEGRGRPYTGHKRVELNFKNLEFIALVGVYNDRQFGTASHFLYMMVNVDSVVALRSKEFPVLVCVFPTVGCFLKEHPTVSREDEFGS